MAETVNIPTWGEIKDSKEFKSLSPEDRHSVASHWTIEMEKMGKVEMGDNFSSKEFLKGIRKVIPELKSPEIKTWSARQAKMTIIDESLWTADIIRRSLVQVPKGLSASIVRKMSSKYIEQFKLDTTKPRKSQFGLVRSLEKISQSLSREKGVDKDALREIKNIPSRIERASMELFDIEKNVFPVIGEDPKEYAERRRSYKEWLEKSFPKEFRKRKVDQEILEMRHAANEINQMIMVKKLRLGAEERLAQNEAYKKLKEDIDLIESQGAMGFMHPAAIAHTVIESVPQMGAVMSSYFVGGPIAAYMVAKELQEGELFDEYKEANLPAAEALERATLVAIPNAALEIFFPFKLLKRMRGKDGLMSRALLAGFVEEGSPESVQGMLAEVGKSADSLSDIIRILSKPKTLLRGLKDGIVGGLAGSMTAGPAFIVSSRILDDKNSTPLEKKEAQTFMDTIDNAYDKAREYAKKNDLPFPDENQLISNLEDRAKVIDMQDPKQAGRELSVSDIMTEEEILEWEGKEELAREIPEEELAEEIVSEEALVPEEALIPEEEIVPEEELLEPEEGIVEEKEPMTVQEEIVDRTVKEEIGKREKGKPANLETYTKPKAGAEMDVTVSLPEPAQDAFFVYDSTTKEFNPAIKTQKIKIPGYDGFDFFVEDTGVKMGFKVVEAISGKIIATGNSVIDVTQKTTDKLSKIDQIGLSSWISDTITDTGFSPRYEGMNIQEVRYAEKVRAEIKEKGEEVRIKQEEAERIRIRDLEEDRVEAVKEEEVEPEVKKPKKLKDVSKVFEEQKIEEEVEPGTNVILEVDLRDKEGKSKVLEYLKKVFRPRGNLPLSVYLKKRYAQGQINRIIKEAGFISADLKEVINLELGKKPEIEREEAIDAALKGEVDINSLPARLRPHIRKMRNFVDKLTRELIKVGAIQGDLIAKFEENIGSYLTRAYKVHKEKGYAKTIPKDVMNRARALLKRNGPDLSEDEITGIIEEILREDPMSIISRGALIGSKDISILMKRGDIAPEIRELLGEYKQVEFNFMNTASKMASLLANHKLLLDIKEIGLKEGFMREKRPIKDLSYRIKTPQYDSLHPLQNIYTTEEIGKALEIVFVPKAAIGNLARTWYALSAFPKYAKTVGSLKAQIRNPESNILLMVAQGYFNPKYIPKALTMTYVELGMDKIPLFGDVFNRIIKLDKKKYREMILEALEFNLVDESVHANEFKALMEDAGQAKMNMDEFHDHIIKKTLKKPAKIIQKTYQAGDNVFKIYAWESELARQKYIDPDVDIEILKKRASEIVRRTQPTYSELPEIVQLLRRVPLIAPFVAFPAAVTIGMANTAVLIREELSSSNPRKRKAGAARLAGTLIALSIPPALSILSKSMQGMSDKDEENERRFATPWGKNSIYFYLDRDKNNNPQSIDLTYVTPHAIFMKFIVAAMSNEDPEEKFWDSLEELFSPILGEDLLSSRLMDIRSNKKQGTETPIYNTEERWLGTKGLHAMRYLWGAFEPGVITDLVRVGKGYFGDKYNPKTELLAMVTGQRVITSDIKRSLGFKIRGFKREIFETRRIFTKTLFSRSSLINERTIIQAYDKANKFRKKKFEELAKDIQSAMEINMTESEIINQLKINKVTEDDIDSLLQGVYYNIYITPSIAETVEKIGKREVPEAINDKEGKASPLNLEIKSTKKEEQ